MNYTLIYYTLFLPSERITGVKKVSSRLSKEKAVKRTKQALIKKYGQDIKIEVN
jgi:hypothetical protein